MRYKLRIADSVIYHSACLFRYVHNAWPCLGCCNGRSCYILSHSFKKYKGNLLSVRYPMMELFLVLRHVSQRPYPTNPGSFSQGRQQESWCPWWTWLWPICKFTATCRTSQQDFEASWHTSSCAFHSHSQQDRRFSTYLCELWSTQSCRRALPMHSGDFMREIVTSRAILYSSSPSSSSSSVMS